MKSLLKGAFVAGALALSVAATAEEADAAPAVASWYGADYAGQLTANGEIFDPSELTAAHKTLPFGTEVQVCYEGCTVVTINDRGPFVGGRDYDLSRGAADVIGLLGPDVATVDATVLGQGVSAGPAGADAGSYGGGNHAVQAGDTLYGIAQSYGVPVQEIASANGISDVSLIYPGQTFYVPGGAA